MVAIQRFFYALWKCLFLAAFLSILLLLYPFLVWFLADRKRYKYAFYCQKIMATWICFFSGIFIKKVYEINPDEIPQPCVIVSNHASYLDIIVSYFVIKKYFVFMAKFELNKAPLFSIFFKDMQISVNRESRTNSHKAFIRAGEEIDKGHSIFIFPEGTISSFGELKNFKNGPFKLAVEKQVPILPITFVNNWKLLQNGGFFKSYGRPGISTIVIHKPIKTTGLKEENIVDLRSQVFSLIDSILKKYNNED
jgi:1-acyl-sn-glycerol-3-phosphate acyltransferase